MTDREMLELAAKAAGLVNHRYCKIWRCMAEYAPDEHKFFGKSWNPLVSDGDALRLAVKLDMQIIVNRVDGFVLVIAGYNGEIVIEEEFGDDMYAATRRAITRAAEQIGKSMP